MNASTSARSFSSDTMAITRPMYAPSSTGVVVLTDEWQSILTNNLGSGEVLPELLFCNRGSSGTFTVAIVPQGEDPGDEFLIYSSVPIAANETLIPPIKPTLRPGDSIYALASANNTVNIFVNYLAEQ